MHRQTNLEPFEFWEISKFMITLPLITAGFLLCFLHWLAPAIMGAKSLGTIWAIVLVFTLVAALKDFPIRDTVVIFIAALCVTLLLWVIGLYIEIPIFTRMLRWLFDRDFSSAPDLVMFVTVILAFIMVCDLINIWLNYRWLVTHGTLICKKFLAGSEEQIISPPYKVTPKVPDLMDSVLLNGGGYLLIKNGKKIVRRILVFRVRYLARKIQPYQAQPTEIIGRSTPIEPGERVNNNH